MKPITWLLILLCVVMFSSQSFAQDRTYPFDPVVTDPEYSFDDQPEAPEVPPREFSFNDDGQASPSMPIAPQANPEAPTPHKSWNFLGYNHHNMVDVYTGVFTETRSSGWAGWYLGAEGILNLTSKDYEGRPQTALRGVVGGMLMLASQGKVSMNTLSPMLGLEFFDACTLDKSGHYDDLLITARATLGYSIPLGSDTTGQRYAWTACLQATFWFVNWDGLGKLHPKVVLDFTKGFTEDYWSFGACVQLEALRDNKDKLLFLVGPTLSLFEATGAERGTNLGAAGTLYWGVAREATMIFDLRVYYQQVDILTGTNTQYGWGLMFTVGVHFL